MTRFLSKRRQDEIIRMAQEAGFDAHDMSDDFSCNLKDIIRFYELAYAAGAKAEREACAKVCEELFQRTPPYTTYAEAAQDCADEIRARGEK